MITRRDALIAGITLALALLLLMASPLVATADPQLSAETASVAELSWWLLAVTLIAQSASVAYTRAAPRRCTVMVTATPLLMVWFTASTAFGLTSIAVLVSVYLAVTQLPMRRLYGPLAIGFIVYGAAHGTNEIIAGEHVRPIAAVGTAVAQAAVTIGAPLAVGLIVVARVESRRNEARARDSERDAHLQTAIADHQAATARELHDLAAHHLSAIALMAAAVERQADADPSAAKKSALQMRQHSSMALDDLRRLVGLLRGGETDPTGVQTVTAIPEMVEQLQASQTPIDLHIIDNDAGRSLGHGLGSVAQLTAYRMAQEALVNAASHAPGASRQIVIDDHDDNHLVVTVRNGPAERVAAPSHEGFGLRGMRERADLIGASLEYGPIVDGGWKVQLSIPRSDEDVQS